MTSFTCRDNIGKLKALLDGASKVTVLSHTHPDGDALGSSAGLCIYLSEVLGKDAAAVLPDTPGESIRFIIPEGIPYIMADADAAAAELRILESDLLVLVDANCFSRTEQLRDVCAVAGAPKVLIDHHLNPATEDFSLVFSTTEISSASELEYWILKELSGGKLPRRTMEALLAGMTTDTNNFSNSVFPGTFAMASEIIAAGVDRDAILLNIYNKYRENRIRLMGYMQAEEMKITPDGAAYMILSRKIQERFGYREGEAEGLVNVPLAIGGVRLSVLATQKDGLYRISVRSKKGTSAQRLAAEYFHGGGHENAAGGKILPEDASCPEKYILDALDGFFGK